MMRGFVFAVILAAWVVVGIAVLAAAVRAPRSDRRPVDG